MNTNLYLDLAETSPHPKFVFDLDKMSLIYANAAFRTLINVPSNQLDLNYMISLVPRDDQEYLKDIFKYIAEGGSKQTIEFRLRPSDNEERWIRLTPAFIEEQRHLMFGNAVDITAEITNINTFKKYANKKNSILNILAHDLIGPLGIAQTLSSVLINKVKDPKLKGLIDTIVKVNKQAIDLIRDLTEREFLETAEVVLVKQRVNIALKLKEVIQEYQASEELSKRTFEFSSSCQDIFIDIDESKFMQIINNLMSNALKFTRDNGIISIKVDEQKDSVVFSVTDNGIGIPEEYHSTLFDKFTNARRKGLRGELTVGLGMSIIKTLVEWHNGKIWFESKENTGTTVSFEIPKGC